MADMRRMPEDGRFCPSWAEAHERTLASLNNGRAPYKVRWKGCILLKKGQEVDVVDVDKTDGSNEIILQRATLVLRRRSVLTAISPMPCGRHIANA